MRDAIKVMVILLALAAYVVMVYMSTQKQIDSNNRLAEATEAYTEESKEFTRAADRLADALEQKAKGPAK